MFIISSLITAILLCIKPNTSSYDSQSYQSKTLTFVASSETMGDGKSPTTMDYFQGVQYPYLSLVIPYALEFNPNIEVVNWEDPTIDWSKKQKVILGPVWGYTKKIDAFFDWLEKIEKENVNLTNSTKFIKWNIKKTYLIDLQENNVAIPNTLIFLPDSPKSFDEAVEEFQDRYGKKEFILKGVVDAGGFGYFHPKTAKFEEVAEHYELLKRNNYGVILQEFIPEIYKKGELSFVFFNGEISHYYVKVPKYDEDRVQAFYGGKSFHLNKNELNSELNKIKSNFRKDLELSKKEIFVARQKALEVYNHFTQVLDKKNIPHPKYVRMDGVLVNDQFLIMELEGIEPYMEIEEAMQHDPNNNIVERYVKSVLDLTAPVQN